MNCSKCKAPGMCICPTDICPKCSHKCDTLFRCINDGCPMTGSPFNMKPKPTMISDKIVDGYVVDSNNRALFIDGTLTGKATISEPEMPAYLTLDSVAGWNIACLAVLLLAERDVNNGVPYRRPGELMQECKIKCSPHETQTFHALYRTYTFSTRQQRRKK